MSVKAKLRRILASTIHRLQGTTMTDDITIYDFFDAMDTKLRYTHGREDGDVRARTHCRGQT